MMYLDGSATVGMSSKSCIVFCRVGISLIPIVCLSLPGFFCHPVPSTVNERPPLPSTSVQSKTLYKHDSDQMGIRMSNKESGEGYTSHSLQMDPHMSLGQLIHLI